MQLNPIKSLLAIFLSVSFIAFCDRVYIEAHTYLCSKIWMCFGARLEGLFYIAIIAFAIPVTWIGLKLVAKIFLVWRSIGFIWFCYIQFTADHAAKEILWGNGFKGSGAMVKSILLGTAQETFVLSVPIIIAYSLWVKSQSVRGINGLYNK